MITTVPSARRWPDEPAALELLREQAGTLAVVPDHLDQAAAPAPEDEEMTAEWCKRVGTPTYHLVR